MRGGNKLSGLSAYYCGFDWNLPPPLTPALSPLRQEACGEREGANHFLTSGQVESLKGPKASSPGMVLTTL